MGKKGLITETYCVKILALAANQIALVSRVTSPSSLGDCLDYEDLCCCSHHCAVTHVKNERFSITIQTSHNFINCKTTRRFPSTKCLAHETVSKGSKI